MLYSKRDLLLAFRNQGNITINGIQARTDKKARANVVNQAISSFSEPYISAVTHNSTLSNQEKLRQILLISYVRDIVMLEYRNKVWEYDYMAFSRRVGEIWEPLCKLPFFYPSNQLQVIDPPTYEASKVELISAFEKYIANLNVSEGERVNIETHYSSVWDILDSGNISLSLDLHFIQNGIEYNVDYKSGFSSNEKGNTNRLLQVGCLYSILPTPARNLIFVRQPEEENNHYLQALKNSPYWEVFCADAAYRKIKEYSGFDLQRWMSDDMAWGDDISPEFRKYLVQHDLFRYLVW